MHPAFLILMGLDISFYVLQMTHANIFLKTYMLFYILLHLNGSMLYRVIQLTAFMKDNNELKSWIWAFMNTVKSRIEAADFLFAVSCFLLICHQSSYLGINVLITKGYNICPELIVSHYRASVQSRKGKGKKRKKETKKEREREDDKQLSSEGWNSMNKKTQAHSALQRKPQVQLDSLSPLPARWLTDQNKTILSWDGATLNRSHPRRQCARFSSL